MKKVCCLLLSCLLIATMATGASAVVYGKNGYEYYGYSESTAWEINSAAVLERVRDDINSGKIYYEAYFKLTNDIDLTGEQYMDWIPIGGNQVSELAEPENPFDGHFDGNGHTIKMNISKVVTDIDTVYHGLFGTILGGTVKNLSVSGNIEVYTRTIARKMYVGGIAANLIDGSIENCNFDGKIVASNQGDSSNEAYVGGIVSCAGLNYYIFNIKDCKIGSKSATTITATSKSFKDWGIAGGVVGRLDDNSYRGEYSTVTGNWVKATLKAGETGYVYGQRGRAGGRVYNNTEVDPNFVPPLTLTGTFGAGVKGAAYSGSATVSGGTAPYTWKYSGLPDGLKVAISGTSKNKITLSNKPTKAQSYSFKVTATDKNSVSVTKTFSIKVTQPTITGTFGAGIKGAAYSGSATVSGGTAPYTWKYSGVPDGLKLTISGTSKNKITLSNKPTKAQNYSFKVTATDKNGVTGTKTFAIKVTQPAITGTFGAGIKGAAYSGSATVSGGTAPYTWKYSGLPDGLKVAISGTSKNKITLSNKPTKAQNYSFKVTATDKNSVSVTKTFTIKVTQPTITGTFGAGVKGAAYSGSATVSGGTAPYTWKYSGVPDGLKVTISGTSKNKITLSNKPTKAQSYSFKVTATDKNGVAATKTFTIKVTQPASKLAFSGSFTDGFVDEYYSRTLKVSGGTEPYTWSKTGTGTWPTGLKLSKTSTGATLKLYGTPSKAGKYKFTLAVTDSKGVSASKTFTINISEEEFEDIDFSVASAKSFSIKKVLNGANSFLYNSVVEETPNAEQEADRSFSVANTSLKVLSDDILKQGEGRDEDLVDVRANEPVRFMIGEWLDANGAKAEVSSEDVYIYIDDKPVEDIIVSDEGLFTVPADFVHDDFKVQAIAETATKRLETVELFVSAIE